jgi:uncharacterized membrane protein YeaQ/YmgE (transglycosylase-associated protein family)
MDPVSMMLVLSIGSIVGWLAAMYVKDALPGLIGHVVIATIGAFIAGYLALRLFPGLYFFGLVVGAFIGAAGLLYLVRFKNWRYPNKK